MAMALEDDTKRVLLVDDEEPLVWSLSSRLSKSRQTYEVETANDGATALRMINSKGYDLLVADVRMPGMSGTDLVLEARRVQPMLAVVMMTAYRTADVQRFVSTSTATMYLEKPFEYERFVQVVDEALSRPAVGFSGAISVQTLPDVVQLYALSNSTGLLRVNHGKENGQIFFEQGAVVHAVTDGAQGEEAFYEVMRWSAGEFSMRPGQRAQTRSIGASWQELLMESCRRIDEAQRGGAAQAKVTATGWTIIPPPGEPGKPGTPEEAEGDEDLLGWGSSFDARSTEPPPMNTEITERINNESETRMDIKESLTKLNTLDGFLGACLVDSESGMLLGMEGGALINLEVAAAGNTEVVRAKRKTMQHLNLKDGIEDILISLTRQYHIIRPLKSRPTVFYYIALDRSRANLALARLALADVEKDVKF